MIHARIVLCFAFLAIAAVNAAPVTFNFTGSVTQVPVDEVFGDIGFGEGISSGVDHHWRSDSVRRPDRDSHRRQRRRDTRAVNCDADPGYRSPLPLYRWPQNLPVR